MGHAMKNSKVTIIAGPCSIDETNQDQLFEIAQIKTSGTDTRRAVWGVRVVGLKSRTSRNETGAGMGIDFHVYTENLERYMRGESQEQYKLFPSIHLAHRLVKETGVVIGTEIVDPLLQLPLYEKVIPNGKLFAWNPSVNQLGYQTLAMSKYVARNNWYLGIKNGKWLGDTTDENISTMEKSWSGLINYAEVDAVDISLIHRGVDVSGKGNYRNLPVHSIAQRIKQNFSAKLFFDPSHSFGPLLKHKIVDETIAALRMVTDAGDYLYDGLLIEVGESVTDTEQHIPIKEFQRLCNEISVFRQLQSPET